MALQVKKHRTLLPTSVHAALGFLVCAAIVLQVRVRMHVWCVRYGGVNPRSSSSIQSAHSAHCPWHTATTTQVVAGIEKLDAQRSGVESTRGGGGGLHR